MSVEGWKAVREQVELIATEVVEQERSWDVIYGIHQKGLLTEDQVAQLRVCFESSFYVSFSFSHIWDLETRFQ